MGEGSNSYPVQIPSTVTPLGNVRELSLLLLHPLQPDRCCGAAPAYRDYFWVPHHPVGVGMLSLDNFTCHTLLH